MAEAGLSIFETTVQETNTWLNEISREMGDPRKKVAYHALRGVLFALRDRLTEEEVFDLSAQLPMLIRGIYFEGYRPAGKPIKYSIDEFIQRVNKELQVTGPVKTIPAIKAVLKILEHHISSGEMEDIRSSVSSDYKDFWTDEPTP